MRQPKELLKHQIPSLDTLLNEAADSSLNAYNCYFDYLIHFIRSEQLTIKPYFEANFLSHIIESTNASSAISHTLKTFQQMILATQKLGDDEIYLYQLFVQLMNRHKEIFIKKDYVVKLNFYFELLDNLRFVQNPKEIRTDYLIKTLDSEVNFVCELLKKRLSTNDYQKAHTCANTFYELLKHTNTDSKYNSHVFEVFDMVLNFSSLTKGDTQEKMNMIISVLYESKLLDILESIKNNSRIISTIDLLIVTLLHLAKNQNELSLNTASLLVQCYEISDVFVKYTKEILSIIHLTKKDLVSRYVSQSEIDQECKKIFQVTQFALKHQEYSFINDLVELLNNKGAHFKYYRFFAIFNAIRLFKKNAVGLVAIYNLPLYQQLNEYHQQFIQIDVLHDWMKYIFVVLDTIDKEKGSSNPYAHEQYQHYFINLTLQKFSNKELIHYFVALFYLKEPIVIFRDAPPSKDEFFVDCSFIVNENTHQFYYYDTFFKQLHLLKIDHTHENNIHSNALSNALYLLRRSAFYHLIDSYKNFAIRLMMKMDIHEVECLGTTTQLHYQKCVPRLNAADLISYCAADELAELMNCAKIEHFLKLNCPLKENPSPIPYQSMSKMPNAFYFSALTQHQFIPPSLGIGLLKIENVLSFEELKPLLHQRNALVLMNDFLYYADQELSNLMKLKTSSVNQHQILTLKSKFIESYQLADEDTCRYIGLLINKPILFQQFVKSFESANKFAVNHPVNYFEFMYTNTTKIFNLYQFMGEEVFLFMKKMIGSSNLGLNRYFENYIEIPKKYHHLITVVKRNFGIANGFDIFLLHIGLLEKLLLEIENKEEMYATKTWIENLEKLSENANTQQELLDQLSKIGSQLYVQILDFPKDFELDLSKFERDVKFFLRLLIARRVMKNDHLNTVFDKLIEYDIRKDVCFTDFAFNLNQTDKLGLKLTQYNQAIQVALEKCSINTTLAFDYPDTVDFCVELNSDIDLPNLANTVYTYLKKIKDLLTKSDTHTFFKNYKTHILKTIHKIQTQIEKSPCLQTIPIQNGVLDEHLNTIAKNLETMLTQEENPEFKVHVKHFLDYKEALFKARKKIATLSKNEIIQKKEFYIAQWDKKQIETFMLGDYLSCCLAPDGGQFPAIVQRRMDAAMMMHVVYDKAFDEPICGNWLYFGYDKNNSQDIYVIANYFEIRTSYALNAYLRDSLVDELLEFTRIYTEKVGAKGFLLKPLTYGLIPNFKTLELKNISVEKVGGFFDPTKDKDSKNTVKERYYLDSLQYDHFYVYKPKSCSQNLMCI